MLVLFKSFEQKNFISFSSVSNWLKINFIFDMFQTVILINFSAYNKKEIKPYISYGLEELKFESSFTFPISYEDINILFLFFSRKCIWKS